MNAIETLRKCDSIASACMSEADYKDFKKFYDEFMIANTGAKVGKFDLTKWRNKKGQYSCVYYDDENKLAIATNYGTLVTSKSLYKEPELGEKTGMRAYDKSGVAQRADLPKTYDRVIPCKAEGLGHISKNDATEAIRAIKAEKKANPNAIGNYVVEITKGIYFWSDYVKLMLTLPKFEFKFATKRQNIACYDDGDIRAAILPMVPKGVEPISGSAYAFRCC